MCAKPFETINIPYHGDYPPPDPEHLCLNASDLQTCFEGILRTIWLSSDKKYNTSEIELKCKTVCRADDTDATFVLDNENQLRYGTGPSMAGQYLAVRFRRIRVLPIAYALRSQHNPDSMNQLRSWAFQAKNAGEDTWTTLDERFKEERLKKPGSFIIAFVETKQYFTEFRVLQTGPSHTNYLSFNLGAFEIHGWTKRIGE
jgi:hypothetical protein